MTILLDNSQSIASPALAPARLPGGDDTDARQAAAAVLEIGLINNMPDSALQATERQFTHLLNAAAGERPIRLHLFSLPGVIRSDAAKARLGRTYTDIAELGNLKLDGLIVTGAEPRTASLAKEGYWEALTETVDWAESNTRSTIWSCLAAHAAVLHFDGIERHRLEQKCSGIYDCTEAAEHWLTRGIAWPLRVSHSRLNGIRESDLTAKGYRVLSSAGNAGVDIFARQRHSQFIFFQGHPEYDPYALKREYVRDINRFLAGEQDGYPPVPTGYFDTATEAALAAFRARALAERKPALIADRPRIALRPGLVTEPGAAAAQIFRNWLNYLSDQKAD